MNRKLSYTRQTYNDIVPGNPVLSKKSLEKAIELSKKQCVKCMRNKRK